MKENLLYVKELLHLNSIVLVSKTQISANETNLRFIPLNIAQLDETFAQIQNPNYANSHSGDVNLMFFHERGKITALTPNANIFTFNKTLILVSNPAHSA